MIVVNSQDKQCQTQRKLTFENRGDSDVLRAIGELGKDLREDIRSINDKLAALEKKIDNYETTVENLKQHNKALEDRVLQLENKIKTSQDQKRQYNVILHGIEDGDTKPQETYQRAYLWKSSSYPISILTRHTDFENQDRRRRTHAQ